MDDQNVHFRPQQYWKSGTKVSVAADVYGVQMAPGMYGQADTSTSFKIGARHVSIADDKTHMVKVYKNGTLIKKMPTSMGKGGSEVSNGQTITFWTQRGTYTVLDQGNPDQHRRHLRPLRAVVGMGAGQAGHLARLPERLTRQRRVVLQVVAAR